jgi:hypothetical protein
MYESDLINFFLITTSYRLKQYIEILFLKELTNEFNHIQYKKKNLLKFLYENSYSFFVFLRQNLITACFMFEFNYKKKNYFIFNYFSVNYFNNTIIIRN